MLRAVIFGWLVLATGIWAGADDVPAAAPLPGPAGIGAVLVDKNGEAVISQVIPHSPAAAGGLKALDAIVCVDYRDVAGMKLEEIVGLIRGESGTDVAITVKSPGEAKPRTVTLTRAPIRVGP